MTTRDPRRLAPAAGMLPRVHAPSPRIRRRQTVHRNPFQTVEAVEAEFEGFAKQYYVVDFGPRVGIVAWREGRVLLTAQYRFLIDRVAWEIPGGQIEAEESPEVAVQRECLEETGVFCAEPRFLVKYRPGLDNVENLTHVFYSDRVEERRPFVPDPAEVVALAWVPLEDCVTLVLEGVIADCLTVAAVLAFRALQERR
jgi:8-oxo-dGTP pyrophosphatase MutT (NUDIX family)